MSVEDIEPRLQEKEGELFASCDCAAKRTRLTTHRRVFALDRREQQLSHHPKGRPLHTRITLQIVMTNLTACISRSKLIPASASTCIILSLSDSHASARYLVGSTLPRCHKSLCATIPARLRHVGMPKSLAIAPRRAVHLPLVEGSHTWSYMPRSARYLEKLSTNTYLSIIASLDPYRSETGQPYT
jgi:hypothetical protein